ncbi:MAG: potassium channel family protein [Gammaproteobacteria bacterium]|nr:potassium channel family protein [Gammaproteobacteria bacterium]
MKFSRQRINQLTGLAGVSPHETESARRWADRLEWPMLMVAFWIPVQWYLEEVGLIDIRVAKLGDWFIWCAFVVESLIMLVTVHDKWRYLLHNWMNVAIILTGILIVWGYTPVIAVLRSLRLLLVLGLLLRISRTMTEILQQNNLGNLLAFALFMVVISGILISGIDPAIETPWQGIWWALVSITTVGYGDVVPVSGPGKFFASMLIILGIVVFSLLTANVSAFLIRRSSEQEEEESQDLLRDIQRRLERIEVHLKKMEQDKDNNL